MSAFFKKSQFSCSLTTHIIKIKQMFSRVSTELLVILRNELTLATLSRVGDHLKRCSYRRPEAGLIGPLTRDRIKRMRVKTAC